MCIPDAVVQAYNPSPGEAEEGNSHHRLLFGSGCMHTYLPQQAQLR